jgi:DNA (cytosine-5)-methyltransferase 1
MTQNGQAYELPTPVHHTTDSESSSLPTPTVFHTTMHDEPIEYFLEREERSSTGQIGKSLGVAIRMEMLPTPVASEGYKAPSQQTSETKSKTGQVWLSNVAKDIELMGTPRASAADSSAVQVELGAPKSRIEDQVLATTWGRFEPAIRRWETVLGRPAPAPTNPDGKDGNHRLSSKFTEWMMGLPDGWITDAGLTRNEELKACGNGVVPQQAELALRMLLK